MTRSTILFGAALCLTSGALLGQVLLPTASAQEAERGGGTPLASSEPLDLRCRSFQVDLARDGGEFRARDGSNEIGEWVRQREDEGWSLHSVDLEIGTKGTGYPVTYNQVCLQKS
jgi:hypothetical protein